MDLLKCSLNYLIIFKKFNIISHISDELEVVVFNSFKESLDMVEQDKDRI